MKIYGQPMTWQKLYNGQFYNSSDNGRGLCETTNSNIYLTGWEVSEVGIRAEVFKLNPSGDTIWARYFNGIRGFFILPTSEGGCIITGEASFMYTLKLDSNGNTIWFKTYENSSTIPNDFIKTSDGGFAIVGYQVGNLTTRAYVLKLDSLGEIQWQKYFYAGNIKYFNSICENPKGNYIISGGKYACELCNGYSLLLKLNNAGDSLWENTYNLFAEFKKIYPTKNGYLIGGTILDSPYVYANSFIMRTSLEGDIYFRKSINYLNREDMKDMKIINENKYIIACDTDTLSRRSAGVYVIDSSANIIHRNIFYVTDYSLFFSILMTLDNYFVFSGTVDTSLPQRRDIFAVRTDSTLSAKPLGIFNEHTNISNNFNLFQNFPNPFNPITKIRYDLSYKKSLNFQIKIYDITGRTLATYTLDNNYSHEIIFDGSNLASGIYFYSLLINNEIVQTKKMILLE